MTQPTVLGSKPPWRVESAEPFRTFTCPSDHDELHIRGIAPDTTITCWCGLTMQEVKA